MHDTQLWTGLLPRLHTYAPLLEQLHNLARSHRLRFNDIGSVLLESGFTLPEAQELYELLRD